MQVATVFGRPNWEKIFTDIKKKHQGKRVGVFVCGPKVCWMSFATPESEAACRVPDVPPAHTSCV